MFLMNELFEIIDSKNNGESYLSNIKINSEHVIFKGHFPGNPILPGVCMLELIKLLSGIYLNKKLKVVSASDMKFLKVINPIIDCFITTEIIIKINENENYSITAYLKQNETPFFKFKGLLFS